MGATTLREIGLDELPRWSPWPARLLGLTGAEREPRTPESILREYDQDKYGTLLRALDADPSLTVDDLKRMENGDADVAMSLSESLYVAPIAEAFERATSLFMEFAGRHLDGARSVVDLGCGYGYHLARLGRLRPELALSGGEFAPSGRVLASRLHEFEVDAVDLVEGVAPSLSRAAGPVVVVLSMVLHQLPSAAPALDTLALYRDRIACVLVYDALEGVQPDSLLGLMRRRYIQLNRYSWDLLSVVGARSDVEVVDLEPNVIGTNAFLPGSFVALRFVS